MEQVVNPNMIILARESRGLTQKELAQLLKITQGYISKIENGFVAITDKILDEIVYVLRYPRTFFFDTSPIYPPDMAFYRKYKSLSKSAQDKICAIANIIRLHIEKMLVSVEAEHKTIPDCDLDEYETPEQVAMAVREFWCVPRGPIQNMTKIIEEAAIIAKFHQVNTRAFSGMNLPINSNYHLVLMNADMPWDRTRWTEAHELGHILMHRLPRPNMEEEADRFAAEFLMPAHIIRPELSDLSLEQLASLKPRWKVSMAAILKRALTLNKITDRQYKYLWMQMGRLGWRLREPPELFPPPEPPSLLQELIQLHLGELGYSFEEITDLLRTHQEDFIEIYKPKRPLGLVRRKQSRHA